MGAKLRYFRVGIVRQTRPFIQSLGIKLGKKKKYIKLWRAACCHYFEGQVETDRVLYTICKWMGLFKMGYQALQSVMGQEEALRRALLSLFIMLWWNYLKSFHLPGILNRL